MDLDDEELKATRMMNGADRKGRVNKMEQDINKLIEELTNVRPNELSTEGLKLFNKINEIIDKNKELEEEKKDLKDKLNSSRKANEKLSEKNRNLQIEKETAYSEAINNIIAGVDLDNSFIPVSLVEETIEELIKEGRHYNANKIEVLQELLEKREIEMETERMKIDFSKNGEGSILMTAIGNSLYLDKATVDNLKIGDKVAINDEHFKRLVELNFYKIESIDIFIEKLIAIKNNLILISAS